MGVPPRTQLTCLPDYSNSTVGIGQDVVVPEPKHHPAVLLQETVARIMFARPCVLSAVCLDGTTFTGFDLSLCEVQHERWHRMLTPEVPTDPMAPQTRPESALGNRRRSAGTARHLDFVRHLPKPYGRVDCQSIDRIATGGR